MLTSLTLHQFALISQHELNFHTGFNVITGETGAGKSLLLDALSLCIGERADSSMVRHGAEQADIYAQFEVQDNPAIEHWFQEHERPFDDDTLLIRRQLNSQGRSKAWLNGLPISLSELKSLGKQLVHIHSQHAQQALLKPQFVIDWLDNMAGITALALQTKIAYLTYQKLKKQADDIQKASAHRQDRINLLESQLADIEPLLNLNYHDIESEHEELANLDELIQQASQSLYLLDNETDEPSVTSLLSRAIRICDHHSSMSMTLQKASEQLSVAQEHIQDAIALLSDYSEQQQPNPERLQQLDDIMSLAHGLSRKHRLSVEDLLEEAKQWQQELSDLLAQPTAKDLQAQVNLAWEEYQQIAQQLNSAREAAAHQICSRLVKHLQPLALPNAKCEFSFQKKEQATDYNAHGMYDIDLLFSANVGMPMQPLYKIASGGELSRMALVMQVLQATNDKNNHTPKPMLVFDEVDVGISGGTAQIVGELLRNLGETQQLLAITHQAQVAAQAHQHILVKKHHEQQTESLLTIITNDAQIDELARMSGGVTITDVTRNHARSLLATVKN